MIDSYLSDELLVETNHDVLRHLENCSECRGDLASCRELRLRVRGAVKTLPELNIDNAFAVKLRSGLKKTALQPSVWERLTERSGAAGLSVALVGVACLILLAVGGAYLMRSPGVTVAANTNSQNDTVIEANKTRLADAIKAAWSELSGQAVGDHKNCAVKFNLDEKPISLDESATKFGPFNKNIEKTVFAAVKNVFDDKPASRIELLAAHSCIFGGRRFAHIVLRRQGKVISVLVTDTDLPAEADGQITDHINGTLNAAGFTIGHHAIFVVSEMDANDNDTLARAIYPAIRRHIEIAGA